MSNAKLKQAAEEIKEILRKHDIAGAIGLHTPGHGEFFLHVHTSYSCAYMYEDDTIRFNIASKPSLKSYFDCIINVSFKILYLGMNIYFTQKQ